MLVGLLCLLCLIGGSLLYKLYMLRNSLPHPLLP
jgi:hypothetical protein